MLAQESYKLKLKKRYNKPNATNKGIDVKTKVSELTGAALDCAVALAEGATNLSDILGTYWFTMNGKDRVLSSGWSASQNFAPSTNWSHGGPILEREKITISDALAGWSAGYNGTLNLFGPTPLIAAMRCYVGSKLGEEVDVPAALNKKML